jgi:hypothetical protein
MHDTDPQYDLLWHGGNTQPSVRNIPRDHTSVILYMLRFRLSIDVRYNHNYACYNLIFKCWASKYKPFFI